MLTVLRASPPWENSRSVLLYHPLKSEPDVTPLLGAKDRDWCLPRVTADGLEILRYSGDGCLRRSEFGMLEPDPDRCAALDVAEVDLAIIPGVAFDPGSGARLGRGGGYYDRLLAGAGFSAVTIGIAFGCQLQADLPAEPHDQAVAYVVTENGLCSVSS